MRSRDSSSQDIHFEADLCHRLHVRHWWRVFSVEIPRVMSLFEARQVAHVLDGFAIMGVEQRQHRIWRGVLVVVVGVSAVVGIIVSSMVYF